MIARLRITHLRSLLFRTIELAYIHSTTAKEFTSFYYRQSRARAQHGFLGQDKLGASPFAASWFSLGLAPQRRTISQSRSTCPEDPYILAACLGFADTVRAILPESPASHGTSAKAYKKRPRPSNHRSSTSHLLPSHVVEPYLCAQFSYFASSHLTHAIYHLYAPYPLLPPRPSRLLAEHQPHRRYRRPSRACRMLCRLPNYLPNRLLYLCTVSYF